MAERPVVHALGLNDVSSRVVCTVVRRVQANDVSLALYARSFACWIKRRVVRAYRATCRSDKGGTTRRSSCFRTTCRPC